MLWQWLCVICYTEGLIANDNKLSLKSFTLIMTYHQASQCRPKPTSIMFEKGITHVAFIPLAIEREMLGFSKVFSVLFCDNKNNWNKYMYC